MPSPEYTPTGTRLGSTDRGTLWWAERAPGHSRIVRLVDQDFSDERFKNELTVILAQERHRMASVVRHGHVGEHYRLEYTVGGDCQTLEEGLAAAPDWRARLRLVRQVCDVLPRWQECPVRPLGLTQRDIVLVRRGEQWLPWLLPCPAVRAASPRQLLAVDDRILPAVAPEVLRGVFASDAGKDMYALGTLAAQAAGCAPARPRSADRVTEQARNALLRPRADACGLPPSVAAGAAGHQLFAVIDRYRHRDPNARPPDAALLDTAVGDVTDVLRLADALGETAEALDLLCLATSAEGGAFVQSHLRAIEISLRLGQLDRARQLAVRLTTQRGDVREGWRRLAEALWRMVESEPDVAPEAALVEQLFTALDVIRRDPNAGSEPYRIACLLHLRLGQDYQAMRESYEAAQRNPYDLAALLLYRDCLLRLDEPEAAAAVVAEAHRRIDNLVKNGMLGEGEARLWHARFDG